MPGDQSAKRKRPETCLTAALSYIALQTPDPGRLATFYQQALGYEVESNGAEYVGRAVDRRLILARGPAKTLREVGYALLDADKLSSLRKRLATADVLRHDGPTLLFKDAVSVVDPDGNRFAFGLPSTEASFKGCDATLPARIQHVVIASQAPERVVRFFTGVIGFTVSDNVVDTEGSVRTSFLRSSFEHHSLAVFKANENRLDHHCYETTDWNMIKTWCDRLAALRIPIVWGPGRHGPGNNLFIFVHDPDGNWVELSAELEQVDHDRPVGRWPHEERTLNSWGKGLLRS